MTTEKTITPRNPKHRTKQSILTDDEENKEALLSPGFRSVAAMAGWDEEALLACAIVEDTPDREPKSNKRINSDSKTTPPASSKRKCVVRRQNSSSIPIISLDMNDEEVVEEGCKNSEEDNKKKVEPSKIEDLKPSAVQEEGVEPLDNKFSTVSSSSSSAVPCMDRLKEELSCAICLEICLEPSTTSCGHSFCKRCLISATERCGKRCPKCRDLISNVGKNCPVNTVLWNTIQLLFPQEVEARKAAEPVKTLDTEKPKPASKVNNSTRNQARRGGLAATRRDDAAYARRRSAVARVDDAEMALRLQREEFLQAFSPEPSRTSMAAARNLRAMASRAMTLRF